LISSAATFSSMLEAGEMAREVALVRDLEGARQLAATERAVRHDPDAEPAQRWG
jgi:hypothetical protein